MSDVAIPVSEPSQFFAGDSISFLKSLSDYTPADGWSLVYYFTGYNLSQLTATSAASDQSHAITITTEQTGALLPGVYTVNGFAVNTGQRVPIYTGSITVYRNPATANAGDDTRSQNRRTLDAINAVLEGRAGSAILNTTIGETRIDRIPHKDLLELKDRYQVAVRNEEIRELQAQGRPTGRTVYAQFTQRQ